MKGIFQIAIGGYIFWTIKDMNVSDALLALIGFFVIIGAVVFVDKNIREAITEWKEKK